MKASVASVTIWQTCSHRFEIWILTRMTYLFHISNLKGYLANFKKQEIFIVIFYWMRTSKQDPGIISQVQMKMKPIKNYQPVCSKSHILARQHILGPPLDGLDPCVTL